MIIECILAEGISFSASLRAAKIILALANEAKVIIKIGHSLSMQPGWRALMSFSEQLQLRTLSTGQYHQMISQNQRVNKLLNTIQDVKDVNSALHQQSRLLRPEQCHQLYITSSTDCLPLPPEPIDVLFLDPKYYPSCRIENYFKKFFICGLSEKEASSKKIALGYPCSTTTTATPLSAQTSRSVLILVGCGVRQDTLVFVHWLQKNGFSCKLFDPYYCPQDYEADAELIASITIPWKNSLNWLDALSCQNAHACVATTFEIMEVDYFCCEMHTIGVPFLATFACLAQVWTEDIFTESVQSSLDLSTKLSQPLPILQSFTEVALKIKDHLSQKPPLNVEKWSLNHHTVHTVNNGADLVKIPNINILIICAHQEYSYEMAIAEILPVLQTKSPQEVMFDVSDNAILFTEFFIKQALLKLPPVKICAHLYDGLKVLNNYPQPLQIAILWQYYQPFPLESLIDNLTHNDAKSTQLMPPQALVYHSSGKPDFWGPSPHLVGVSVAADSISMGLLRAEKKLRMLWQARFSPHQPRSRLTFYAGAERQGKHNDEFDNAMMPQLFGNNIIDICINLDPYIAPLLQARGFWAKKPIPIVGFLHATNPSSLVSDVIIGFTSAPMRHYDAIVSPSQAGAISYRQLQESVAESLGKRFNTLCPTAATMEVIPYGIDHAPFANLHQSACRQLLDLPQESIIITSFGRFTCQDKADLLPLLFAFYQLRKRHTHIHLVLAGGISPDNHHDFIAKQAEQLQLTQHVHIFPNVDAVDKKFIFGASDIFVSLSDNIQETHGLSLLEAMSCGLAVVASNWNGYREIVAHEKTGLLVDTHMGPIPELLAQLHRVAIGSWGLGQRDLHEAVCVSPYQLLQCLSNLVEHRHFSWQLGQAAKKQVYSNFDENTQGNKMAEFMHSRIKLARESSFLANEPVFFDPLQQRFQHFASPNHDFKTLLWQKSTWLEDLTLKPLIIKRLELQSPREAKFIADVLAHLPDLPKKIAGKALWQELSNNGYDQFQLEARLWRAVKYGLIEPVSI